MEVYVQYGRDEIQTTIRILKKAKPKIGERVLIKPNITMPFPPDLGICTSPRVVEGIIKYLHNRRISDIVIGEGAGGAKDMLKHFEISGYKQLSEKYNIPLINLNQDKQVRLKIKKGNSLEEITIPKSILDRYIINVPKMKTHRMAGVTLAMKNMMGVILPYDEKNILHPLYERYVTRALKEKRFLSKEEFKEVQEEFFKRLVDFYSVCKPNLNILDGFVAREGDGLNLESGKTKRMNCVLLSESIPAIDFVASYLMGINLKNLYLKYIRDFNLSNTEILSNVNLKKLKKKFNIISLIKEIKI